MTESSGDWTGVWVAKKMRAHEKVEEIVIIEPQILRVIRKEHGPVVVGTISAERVDASVIEPLLSTAGISFIVNVPKESFVTGDALELARRSSVVIGGLGDLMRALAVPNVQRYVNPEFSFIERGLKQHSQVESIERVADRRYTISRRKLDDLDAVFLNEYELTADHVRTARERYGACANIVITNPNGRATSSAQRAAESMGCEIFMWGEFFGRLNKQ